MSARCRTKCVAFSISRAFLCIFFLPREVVPVLSMDRTVWTSSNSSTSIAFGGGAQFIMRKKKRQMRSTNLVIAALVVAQSVFLFIGYSVVIHGTPVPPPMRGLHNNFKTQGTSSNEGALVSVLEADKETVRANQVRTVYTNATKKSPADNQSSAWPLQCHEHPVSHQLDPLDKEKYTIRMNTWKRNDALQASVDYLSTCEGVEQIQIVWCDQQGDPPPFLSDHPSGKIVVERHKINSLNERFHLILKPPTRGILSIDDDIIYPCQALDNAFYRWVASPDRMVGFQPRGITWQGPPPRMRYLKDPTVAHRGQGVYSIALTSAAFLHRDYMDYYMKDLRGVIMNMIHVMTNCEDLAMSLLISACTGGKAPLLADRWALEYIGYLSPEHDHAISGEKHSHYKFRDVCVDTVTNLLGLQGPKIAGHVRMEQRQLYLSHNASSPEYQCIGAQDGRDICTSVRDRKRSDKDLNPRERFQMEMFQLENKTTMTTQLEHVRAPVEKIVNEFREKHGLGKNKVKLIY